VGGVEFGGEHPGRVAHGCSEACDITPHVDRGGKVDMRRQAPPESRQDADEHSGRKGQQRFHVFDTISPAVSPEE
jgi:hypothetical protein